MHKVLAGLGYNKVIGSKQGEGSRRMPGTAISKQRCYARTCKPFNDLLDAREKEVDVFLPHVCCTNGR